MGVSQFLITPATNESPLAFDQQAHVISSNENCAATMLCFFFCLDAEMRLGGAGKSTTEPFLRYAQDVGWKCSWRGLFGERSGELVFSGGHFVPCVTIRLAQKVNSPRLC